MSAVATEIRHARLVLASELELLPVADRAEAMRAACIDTGGCFVPARTVQGGTHYAEVSCLGVYHAGADMAEAITHWIKAVHRMEISAQTGVAA
ncbi:MAG: hypothetical protein CML02_02355 [Pseudooceanicola sp.]|nr:hypothetical protein [Pseudooceanicola sp.]|tara:strand:- start:700 stop:981 length:282 start_codon:yes stop_codon:yes gene_type:complete